MINTKYIKKLQLSVEKRISFNKYTIYGKTAYNFEINKDQRIFVIFRPKDAILKKLLIIFPVFFRIYLYFFQNIFTKHEALCYTFTLPKNYGNCMKNQEVIRRSKKAI